MNESELLILRRILDSYWAMSFFGEQASELVGGYTGGPTVGMALLLFENPGVRREWVLMHTKREKSWDALYGSNSILIQFNQNVRDNLERLDKKFEVNNE